MSVETHRASVIPHPHEHRSRLAAWSAIRLSLDVRLEKLTTAMSFSVYATPAVCEMPQTISATPAATASHVRIRDRARARFRGRAFLGAVGLM